MITRNKAKVNYLTYLKKGNKIHIKKSHEGRFTEYCGGRVTSECIQKGKSSSDPKIRKQATFAANSRKWKHSLGGCLRLIPKAEQGMPTEDPNASKNGNTPEQKFSGFMKFAKIGVDAGKALLDGLNKKPTSFAESEEDQRRMQAVQSQLNGYQQGQITINDLPQTQKEQKPNFFSGLSNAFTTLTNSYDAMKQNISNIKDLRSQQDGLKKQLEELGKQGKGNSQEAEDITTQIEDLQDKIAKKQRYGEW